MPSFKKQRVGEMLLGFLSQEVRRLGDVRLELLSFTAAEMSPDLKTAWVYWSVLNTPALTAAGVGAPGETGASEVKLEDAGTPVEQEPETMSARRVREIDETLDGVKSLLKRRIAQELKLRYTPQLIFRHDLTYDTASRIDYLVRKAGL